MIERIIYIFVLCVLVRSIKTVQQITQIAGHKLATAVLIAADTLVFLIVFKDIITGQLTIWVILAVALGYMAGYYLGAIVEEKMALGKVSVTIRVAKHRAKDLAVALREHGFVFIQSKRFYNHKGKLRKLFLGIVYRKELPKLRKITKGFRVIASVENVKATFGKEIMTSEEYLEIEKDEIEKR